MTANLAEAFHIAAIRYVAWSTWLDDINHFGCIIEGVPHDRFPPEPEVELFGRKHPISFICQRALDLPGSIPLALQVLFNDLINAAPHSAPSPTTFAGAADYLGRLIGNELTRVRQQPPLVEREWHKGYVDGASFVMSQIDKLSVKAKEKGAP